MRQRPRMRRLALPALLSFLCSFAWLVIPALAQDTTGGLLGRVVDARGRPLAGATVRISGLGAPHERVTDDAGELRVLGLDPGSYRVVATLEGHAQVDRPNARVGAGRITTFTLELLPAIEERLEVVAETPLLNERRVVQGVDIGRVELEQIPVSGDVWSMAVQTPGVLVDRVNVGGSQSDVPAELRAQGVSQSENVYTLDGVQVTDMYVTGASPMFYDLDQLSELQLSTGGTDVTRVTAGVAVNLVTKRGSNEFRGSASFFNTKADGYFGGALAQGQPNVERVDLGDNRTTDGTLQCLPDDPDSACTERYVGTQLREVEEAGFEAGGPLVRDRLWLWGSWKQNDIQRTAASGGAEDGTLEHAAFKLNAQPTRSTAAVFSWTHGDRPASGAGASPSRPDETTWNQSLPSSLLRIAVDQTISDRLFLAGTYTRHRLDFSRVPKNGRGLEAPEAWLRSDRVWQDNFVSFVFQVPNDEFKLDTSYFLRTGSAGHELKIGGRYRRYEHSSSFTWPGRNIYTLNFPGFSFVVAKRGETTPTQMDYTSLWAQDTIEIGRLTANVGLRYDDQSGRSEAATVPANPLVPTVLPALDYPGDDGQLTWSNFSPRLGLTYALGEDRSTLLRLSLARYADQLGVQTVSRTNPAGDAYAYFFVPFLEGPYSGDGTELDDPDRVTFADGFDPSDPTALSDPDRTDPGLEAPVTDEILLALEHAVLPELVLGLTLTGRWIDSIHEERDLVRDPESGLERTVRADDYQYDGEEVIPIPGHYDGPPPTVSIPTFGRRPGLEWTGGTLLLNGSRSRRYLGATLSVSKRLTNRWMLRGHLTYGDAEWEVPTDYLRNSDPNPSPDGSDRDGALYFTDATNFRGARFLQASWSGSLTGLYQVVPDRPWGFNVSGALQARQGFPVPTFARVVTSDGVLRRVGAVSDFDALRLGDVAVLDLRLEKELATRSPLSLRFGLDAFNVANVGTDQSRDREVTSPRYFFLEDNIEPRVYRLGVRLSWK